MLPPGHHALWSLPNGVGLKLQSGPSYAVLLETMALVSTVHHLKSNYAKHLLVAVKQDAEVSLAITWVLLHMCRPGDRLTVLSVSRPSVTGRVLEPLGDEDMVRVPWSHCGHYRTIRKRKGLTLHCLGWLTGPHSPSIRRGTVSCRQTFVGLFYLPPRL